MFTLAESGNIGSPVFIYINPSALQPNLCCDRRVARGNWTHDHFKGGGGPPLIIDIQYITARIPYLARAGPPIPPKLVLKHGELR